MEGFAFLTSSLYEKGAALKQQFTCDTSIYLNWLTFAPNKWKRETMDVLVDRPYNICSSEYLLKKRVITTREIVCL